MDRFEEIDDYVGRGLKNWSARQRPPADGCQRLMQAVANPAPQQPNWLTQILSALINPNSPHERFIYPQSEWEIGPAFSSMVSSFHFASSWRLVN